MGNLSKRNILWVVPFLLIIFYWFFFGPREDAKVEFINYIKESTLNNESTKTFASAFEEHCPEGEWIYFRTSNRQHVVEFTGACPVNSEDTSEINLQFVVEKDQTGFVVGAMLIEGEKQSTEQRDAFLDKILSPTNEIATP